MTEARGRKPDEEGKKVRPTSRHMFSRSRRIVSSPCASLDSINDRVKQRRPSHIHDSRDDRDDPAPLPDHVDLDSENDEAALLRGFNRNQVLPLAFITAYDYITSGTVGNSPHLSAAPQRVMHCARTKLNRSIFHQSRRERKVRQQGGRWSRQSVFHFTFIYPSSQDSF